MLKFILNFILFGFIFFLIAKYFPDAFDRLVEWVDIAWNYIVNLFEKLVEKINDGA